MIVPVNNCSVISKYGSYLEVVSLNNKYYLIVPSGFADTPTPYKITKQEFENFGEWNENLQKICRIQNRYKRYNHIYKKNISNN